MSGHKASGLLVTWATATLLLAGTSTAQAQLQPTTNVVVTSNLNADGHTNVAAARLRRPTTNALGRAHVGVFVMHPYGGYQNNPICDGLARRGFTVVCADSVFTGREDDYYGYEQHAAGTRAGIGFLRSIAATPDGLPAVTKVVILGHSVGAPMMAFYENVAENGPAVCQGKEKIIPCVDTELQGLPKADGVILFDAHLGEGLAVFTYVDPAYVDLATPNCPPRNGALDMFSAANGFVTSPGALNDNGAAYSAQFRRRFLDEQAARNARLLEQALKLLQERRIATGNPRDMGDDIPFIVPGSDGARLWQPDLGLLRSTQRPHMLLARDGTRSEKVIESVRPPSGNARAADCATSTRKVNVHVWLGAKSLRSFPGVYNQTVNDLTGVDYESSATSTVTNVRGIGRAPNGGQTTTPLLIVANTGHYFLRPDEIIYESAVSTDKTIAFSEGAVHGGGPCAACARIILNNPALSAAEANTYWTDPQGNGPADRTYNFMAEWLAARY